MSLIDPTARIAGTARLGDGVRIGPYCVVGPDAVLGDGVELVSHVTVSGRTEIGAQTIVHPFAALGGVPQSLAYKGEPTRLVIGARCVIRESVTMSLGTEQGGGITRVGDDGYFMHFSHVAHDCSVGNKAIFANCATLAGHCIVGDNVNLSGLIAVHQFSWIGTGALAAGGAIIREDVVPFALVAGPKARVTGINAVGMRRRGYSAVAIRTVRAAFRTLFLSGGPLAERLERMVAEHGTEPAVAEIAAFVRAPRKRPLCQARMGRAKAALGQADAED